jgi:hypothetical protein
MLHLGFDHIRKVGKALTRKAAPLDSDANERTQLPTKFFADKPTTTVHTCAQIKKSQKSGETFLSINQLINKSAKSRQDAEQTFNPTRKPKDTPADPSFQGTESLREQIAAVRAAMESPNVSPKDRAAYQNHLSSLEKELAHRTNQPPQKVGKQQPTHKTSKTDKPPSEILTRLTALTNVIDSLVTETKALAGRVATLESNMEDSKQTASKTITKALHTPELSEEQKELATIRKGIHDQHRANEAKLVSGFRAPSAIECRTGIRFS